MESGFQGLFAPNGLTTSIATPPADDRFYLYFNGNLLT